MKGTFHIKGEVLDRDGTPVGGLQIKTYDERGVFLAGASTDKKGHVDVECASVPSGIKLINESRVLAVKEVADIGMVGTVVDWGNWVIVAIPPAEWHIHGTVIDKMSGDPLKDLTVEVWDVDTSSYGGPYYDPLGEDVTDAAGNFHVWFDGSIFEREATWTGEHYPDVLIKIRNAQGVLIHETTVDQNVIGAPHDCPKYANHKGRKYEIEIDYVTVAINGVGPVDVVDINASGRATHAGITDRPFGGRTTISGRIWGAKVDSWKLYYAEGFVDSADARFTGLGPASPVPTGFTMIADGSNKVWDGPIHEWTTTGVEGTCTAILVVWDEDGNEYHDTQVLFLHNTPITPVASISLPAPGSPLSKSSTTSVAIEGTASDDYFRSYALHWVGPTQTELCSAGIAYPAAGNHTPVVGGLLGTWDVTSLPEGPYCLRLSVHDRTILNDGGDTRSDWTWNTVSLTS